MFCKVRASEVCTKESPCEICCEWSEEQWVPYDSKVQKKMENNVLSSGQSGSPTKRVISSVDSSSDSPLLKKSKKSRKVKTKKGGNKHHKRSRSRTPSTEQIDPNGAAHSIGSTPSFPPPPQFNNPLALLNPFLTMLSALTGQTSFGSQSGTAGTAQTMVGAPPDTSRKGGKSGGSAVTYGQAGSVGPDEDQSTPQTDLDTSFGGVGDGGAGPTSHLPVSGVRGRGSAVASSDRSELPRVCGALRPGQVGSVGVVTAAMGLRGTTTVSVASPRMTTRSVSRSGRTETLRLDNLGRTSQAVSPGGPTDVGRGRRPPTDPTHRGVGRGYESSTLFNTDTPPLLPLDPDVVMEQRVRNEADRPRTQSQSRDGGSSQPEEEAVARFQDAIGLLPPDKQSNMAELFKRFLCESSSVASSVNEQDLDEAESPQDPEGTSFPELWNGLGDVVRDYVPSVPEVKLSPVKRRRTMASIDREEPSAALPLHPAVEAAVEACMREVKDGRDRAEPLPVGKFLRMERTFPKKFWTPPDKPKLYLPGVKTAAVEQLVPGFKATNASLSDMDLAMLEAQCRESLIALSQLKWLMEAQAAFTEAILPMGLAENEAKIPYTLSTGFDYIFNFLLDALSVQLVNTVLRRRDMILSQAKKLSPDIMADVRTQPVFQPHVIEVDKQICKEQAEERSRQAMVDTLTSTVSAMKHQSQSSFRGVGRGGQDARRGGRGSGASASFSFTPRGGRGRSRGFFKSNRSNRGRGRGHYNPASTSSSASANADKGKKQ